MALTDQNNPYGTVGDSMQGLMSPLQGIQAQSQGSQAYQPVPTTPAYQPSPTDASKVQPTPATPNTPSAPSAGDPNWGQSLPPGIGNTQQAMTATAAFRNSPQYQTWLNQNGLVADTTGVNGGNPLTKSGQPATLTDAQQQNLLTTMQNAGIGISGNSWHVDQNGQIAQNSSHLLRNILIGAGIGGSLLIPGVGEAVLGGLQSAGSGIAGLFGGGGGAAGAGVGASEAAGAEGATAAGLGVGAGGMGTGGLVGGDLTGSLLAGTAIPGGTALGSAAGAGALGSLVPATSGLDISGALASGSLTGAPGGFDITPSTQISASEPTTTTGAGSMAGDNPYLDDSEFIDRTGSLTGVNQPGTVLNSTDITGLNQTPITPSSVPSGTIPSAPSGVSSIIQKLLGGAKSAGGNGGSGSTVSSLLGGLEQGIKNNRSLQGVFSQNYDKNAIEAQTAGNQARAAALKQLAQSNYLLNGGYRGGQNTIQLNGKQVTLPQLLQAPDPASAAQQAGAANLQNTAQATLAPGGTYTPQPLSGYATPGIGETLAGAGSAVAGILPTLGKAFGWF
jgi:hypothetical protein